MNMATIPPHYIPDKLTYNDKKTQMSELVKSRKLYKKGKYHTRKNMKSFKSKKSKHINNVRKIYNIQNKSNINTRDLSKKTKCSVTGLNKIIKKGMGAYYSSGSRPNQTPQSWGKARLYSAITGGPASQIDKDILEKYCNKNSTALKLANKLKNIKQQGGFKMKERIVRFNKSTKKGKKYEAIVKNIKTGTTRKLHFGAIDYQQYKDRTPLKLYSNKNHGTRKRMQNYFNRHSGTKNRRDAIELEKQKSQGYYNPKILSHEYLW